jgi:UPF0755 protein
LVAVLVGALNQRVEVIDGGSHAVLFTVENGEPFSRVAARLEEEGLISHRRPVALYAWLRRYDRRVKAGTYRLEFGQRPRDILGKLVLGDVHKVSVTIPEGYTHYQIAGELAAVADVDSAVFADLMSDDGLRMKVGVTAASLEGYLFPDTYLIPWGTGPEAIAEMMAARLDEVFDADASERAGKMGMTRHEVLTLASIVEAEARLPEELPLISAVYHNRLKRGMRLEADPTVAYAMGGYKGRLYYKDLEIDSPYNTYKHAGLPPGPIGNPGRAAIRAALHPDSTCRAIYFVAQGNGGHIFSLTLEEHLAAIRRIKKAKQTD